MAKGKKMDPKLVAGSQEHEVNYIHKKFKAPKHLIEDIIKEHGHSRKRIYAILREQGYSSGK